MQQENNKLKIELFRARILKIFLFMFAPQVLVCLIAVPISTDPIRDLY